MADGSSSDFAVTSSEDTLQEDWGGWHLLLNYLRKLYLLKEFVTVKSHTFFVMKRRLLPSSESLENVFSFRKFVKNTHYPVCWPPCKVETVYGIGRSHLLSQNKILFYQHILQTPKRMRTMEESMG